MTPTTQISPTLKFLGPQWFAIVMGLADLLHPVRHAFIATITVALILLATLGTTLLGPSIVWASLWLIACVLQLAVNSRTLAEPPESPAEGARYLAPVKQAIWAGHGANAYRTQNVGYRTMPAPQRNFFEQVWQHDMQADAHDKVPVAVVNDAIGLGFLVETSKSEFPCYLEWQNFQQGQYVIGVEPSTHHVLGKTFAQERDELIQQIAELDDQHALGDVDTEQWSSHRAHLKSRLVLILTARVTFTWPTPGTGAFKNLTLILTPFCNGM